MTNAELTALIGQPPAGSHPDEWGPRAATWHAERANWAAEVAQLRSHATALARQLQETKGENLALARRVEAAEQAAEGTDALQEYLIANIEKVIRDDAPIEFHDLFAAFQFTKRWRAAVENVTAPAAGEGVGKPEACWLIERSQPEKQNPPCWWNAAHQRWVEDAARATRYATRAFAERTLRDRSGIPGVHSQWGHVTEHVFLDRAGEGVGRGE